MNVEIFGSMTEH